MRRMAGVGRTLALGAALWLPGTARGFAQAASPGATIELPEVEVVATSPLPSGGENRDNIPAMVQTVPAEDFARTNSQNITDTLQQQIPAAISIDVSGNPFSQNLRYRGFVASPLQGTPQGLAVYENGIRVKWLLATPSTGTSFHRKRSTEPMSSRTIPSSASTRSAAQSACR